MTILVSARSREALVLGADSQESTQVARGKTQKLLVPQRGLVVAWAGYKDVAQEFSLSLSEEPLDLTQPRTKIATSARERFAAIRSNEAIKHHSDSNEFILGWFCKAEQKPVAFHLHTQGRVEWVEQWKYAGTSMAIATATTARECISYIATDDLGAEQLALIALKVLRDSITVAPPGAPVGGDPLLATVTRAGVHIFEPEELRAGNDALDVWEERCAELLPGASAVPRDVPRVDRGLGPPT
jgi:hypothetical protein